MGVVEEGCWCARYAVLTLKVYGKACDPLRKSCLKRADRSLEDFLLTQEDQDQVHPCDLRMFHNGRPKTPWQS